jgi:REP element-mobilizing transposase RayT
MANTYTQLYVQIVFAVQGRENLIKESFRDILEKYICGIITNNKSKPLAIYCNPDHTHVLIGLHPTISVATITGDIKASSAKWINLQHKVAGKFSWQDGYGAFTYSKSQINDVATYILNQPEHHKKRTFKDEYLSMLQKAEIDFDEAYLFDWLE